MIKAIRQLKLISRVLLTRRQNFLMKFNRENVIDSASQSSVDEDSRVNFIESMRKGNQIQREIDYHLGALVGKELNVIDTKIFKGIVQKKVAEQRSSSDSSEEDLKQTSPQETSARVAAAKRKSIIPITKARRMTVFDTQNFVFRSVSVKKDEEAKSIRKIDEQAESESSGVTSSVSSSFKRKLRQLADSRGR